MKKKMLRRISALLGATILASSVQTLSVFAATDNTTTIYSDSFQNYADDAGLKAVYHEMCDNTDRLTLGSEDDNKFINVALDDTEDNLQVVKGFGKVYNSGILDVKYSVKPASGLTTLFYLVDENYNNGKEMPRFADDNTLRYDWDDSHKLGDYTPGEWYDVEVSVDLTTAKYDITVKKQNGGTVVAQQSGIDMGFSNVGGFRMQVWTHKTAVSSFDNVEIKHTPAKLKEVDAYSQNFNSGNYDGMTIKNAGDSICGVIDDNGEKIFKLAAGATNDTYSPSLVRDFGNVNGGKIHIEADVKPASGNNAPLQIFATLSDNDMKNLLGFDSSSGVRLGWDGTEYLTSYDANTWYHIDLEIDVENGKLTGTISDGNGTSGTLTDQYLFDADKGVKNIYFQIWGKDATGVAYIDNIEIDNGSDTPVNPPVNPPAQTTPTVTLPYTQDFETATIDTMQFYAGTAEANGAIVDGDNGSKVFKLTGTSDCGSPALKFPVEDISDGKLGIEADIKTGSVDSASLVFVEFEKIEGRENVMQPLLLDGDRGIYTEWDKAKLAPSCLANAWYHVKINYDFDNGTMDAEVTDPNGEVYQVTDFAYDTKFDVVKSVNFQIWSGSESTYFDNIKITRNPEAISKKQVLTLPFEENFNSYSNMEDVAGEWGMDDNTKALSSVGGEGADKYLTIGMRNDLDNTAMTKGLSERLNDGVLKFSLDVQPGENVSTHIALYDVNNSGCPVFYFGNDHNIYGGVCWTDNQTPLGSWTEGKWYSCEAVIDFTAGTMKLDWKERDSEATANTKTVNLNNVWGEKGDIWTILLQVWTYADGSSNFDNIKVEYADPKPTLSANSVTIKKNGTVQSNLNDIDPISDTIEVDFGTRMLYSTVENGITLVKKGTPDTDVNIELEFSGTKCIVKPKNGLDAKSEYVLKISRDAQSLSGAKADADFELTFKTNEGAYGVTGKSITENGQNVTTLEGLKAASAPTLKIGYENATETEKTMLAIICSYKDGQLMKCKAEKVTILSTDKSGNKEVSLAGKYESDADRVAVFIWDSLSTILPLTDGVEFK